MRVVILTHSAATADAVGNSIAQKCRKLATQGHSVRVVVESAHRLHPHVRRYAMRTTRQARLWTERADFVLVELSQAFRSLDWLPDLADLNRPIVVDYHGVTPPELWPEHSVTLRAGQDARHCVRYARSVIVHSRFMLDELCDATGYPRDRVRIVPFDVEAIPASDQPRNGRLLYVGRVAPNKRICTLIRALQILDTHHADIVGDINGAYQLEYQRLLRLAEVLGVKDRLRFLGQVSQVELRKLYRTSQVFVMPSLHEGFCVPVREAQRHGMPVVAARAAALPETVGSAGLTFTPDDPIDLARQIRRLTACESLARPVSRRVAIVSQGIAQASGAEKSLRILAQLLGQAGWAVEVYTLGPAPDDLANCSVRSYPQRPTNALALALSAQAINGQASEVTAQTESEYLANLPQSDELLADLAREVSGYSAIVAGPYLSALTHAVACRWPNKTLLVPCFHDEPTARLPRLLAAYRQVGGILYHSSAERELAQGVLGVNVPNSHELRGLAGHGVSCLEIGQPQPGHLVYCGRLEPLKNLPLLLSWFSEYQRLYPERYKLILIGRGSVSGQGTPGVISLGAVSDDQRTDVLANCTAVVQLSVNESLSWAVAEAWAVGRPVIVHGDCEVLCRTVQSCQGGLSVRSAEEFQRALNMLWDQPEHVRAMGLRGQRHILAEQQDSSPLIPVVRAIEGLYTPLDLLVRQQAQEMTQSSAEWSWEIPTTIPKMQPPTRRDLRKMLPQQPEPALTGPPGWFGWRHQVKRRLWAFLNNLLILPWIRQVRQSHETLIREIETISAELAQARHDFRYLGKGSEREVSGHRSRGIHRFSSLRTTSFRRMVSEGN